MQDLTLSSPAFAPGGPIPVQYTADGDNTNPPLVIGGVNSDAKSLVLIVDDPDAMTDPRGPGAVYDHWVIFNIPPTTTEIASGGAPAASVQGKNSAGTNTYIGPAPPSGEHRYFFRLYELSDRLDLDENAGKADVLAAFEPVLLRQTELVGTYRSKR